MFNPSKADEAKNDPTVSRCIKITREEGCTSLTVVNLFALVSTDPRNLLTHKDPVGTLNDWSIFQAILDTYSKNGIVVAAWGAFPIAESRVKIVFNRLTKIVYCLGQNKNGSPKHPLYVKKGTRLERYV
jgi:hypothetical protein